MPQSPRKSGFFIGLFSFCLIIMLTTSLSAADRQTPPPQASHGNLNLSQWDFAQQGPVKLRGEWELYWKLLLNPQQINSADSLKIYHNLPNSWEGQKIANHQLTSEGYGTYRLVINLDSQHPSEMALKIPLVYTAYNLWVNDKLVSSKGIVGIDPLQTKPQGLPQLILLTPINNQVELVLQVSNYHHASGGIWTDFYLGTSEQIMDLRDKSILLEMFLFGSLVIMGIYYLGLFAFRRGEHSNLYFAVFCLLSAVRILFIGEILFIKWFPGLEWEIAKRLEYFTFYLTIPFFSLFLVSLYPDEASRRLNELIVAVGMIYATMVILTPAKVFTATNVSYQIITILCSLYFYYVMIKASLNRREGAIYSLIGGLFLLFTVINDILYYNELPHWGSDLVSIGLLIFIFSQSIILSMRMSHAFTRNEKLTLENADMIKEIIVLNQTLEERIKERTIELSETVAKLNMEIIERKEAEEKLRLYATTDMMTGLPNRTKGMAVLETQIQMSFRKKWYLSICFLDLDGLKTVNDTMGHQAGDELIINTANILAESVRVSDTVSRIGGDEFLIVLPQCNLTEALALWQRVINKIDEFNGRETTPYKIKASYGFAQYNPHEPTSLRALLDEADNNMYKMKRFQINE